MSEFRYRDFRAQKHLGQNFLTNPEILEIIVKNANLSKNDHILEIGPGLGALTAVLAPHVARITVIEKDQRLKKILPHSLSQFSNIEYLFQDALDYEPNSQIPYIECQINNDADDRVDGTVSTFSYKLIANIPYYITSPLINKFLKDQFMSEKPHKIPELILLMVQKEVAQKICAPVGKLNILALNIQTFAAAKIITSVPKENFSPIPKVDSALIQIVPFKKPQIGCDLKQYFRIISAGFRQKRKKLHNSLTHGLHMKNEIIRSLLTSAEIDPDRRAETLSITEWQQLVRAFQSM